MRGRSAKKVSVCAGEMSRITRAALTAILCFYLGACAGGDHHDFHMPGKIPVDGRRWYQLNNTSTTLEVLFNNRQFETPNTGYGLVLGNYDAYYPLLPGEEMTIDSIMMFDWEGTTTDHPLTIYAVTGDWKKILIATFTGARYNAWNGPDPSRPDVYALARPVSGIRYLIINTSGNFPGEIEFYGSYVPPAAEKPVPRIASPLRNYFGVNAFEWDFEEPNDPFRLDPLRLSAIANFTGIRHYLDWDKIEATEGVYNFAPASSGGWNYDTIYQWCKSNNIEVLACIKTVPSWMQASWPADQRDNENVPARSGKPLSDPASYIEQARAGFQFAARYGRNRQIDTRLLHPAPGNAARTGLGTVRYIECDNERDKWWKGRKAYQTGREYAANLSAFYDGHKNTLGPGIGVKNADPSMSVVMAGLAMPDPGYVQGMIDWCKEFRGFRKDGTPDLPWDVINFHYYCNDERHDNKQTTGLPPEKTAAGTIADSFIHMAYRYAGAMPVWITETGYDLAQSSPQKAAVYAGSTAEQVQAQWSLRTSLVFARAGIGKVFFYELMDDNAASTERYGTSGLIGGNRAPRLAASWFRQVTDRFGDFIYRETISSDPAIDRYSSGNRSMYVAWLPVADGATATATIKVGKATTVSIYKLNAVTGEFEITRQQVTNGNISVTVSGTPAFISIDDNQ